MPKALSNAYRGVPWVIEVSEGGIQCMGGRLVYKPACTNCLDLLEANPAVLRVRPRPALRQGMEWLPFVCPEIAD
jgi:hypothetical protein